MSDTTLEDLLNEIRRQNNWLKLQNEEKVREKLKEMDEEDKRIFQYTDGETSMRDVASKTHYSIYTPVQTKMRKWRAQGLVFKNSSGTWEHLAPMEAFGLEPPAPAGETRDTEQDNNEGEEVGDGERSLEDY